MTKPLSESVEGTKVLVKHIRDLIFRIRENVSPINNLPKIINPEDFINLKKLLADSSGDIYSYYYDKDFEDYDRKWQDPAGNNILLHLTSICSHLNVTEDKFIELKLLTEDLINFVLQDARKKLSPEEFCDFLNFQCVTGEIYYQNTSLTLAIQSGLMNTASLLIDNGADVNKIPVGGYGFSPLSLAVLRLTHLESEDSRIDTSLITKLVEHRAHCDPKSLPQSLTKPTIDTKVFKVTNLSLDGFVKNGYYSLSEILAKKDSFKEIQRQALLENGSEGKLFIARDGFTPFNFDKEEYSYNDIVEFANWISKIRNSKENALFTSDLYKNPFIDQVAHVLTYDPKIHIDLSTSENTYKDVYTNDWIESHKAECEFLSGTIGDCTSYSDHK